MNAMPASVSVIVLTFNEEQNIGRCLESVAWCDDVVVLDSESTDATRDIALQHGARVEVRPFDNYANQRNHALHDLRYRHQWVLMLDADEVVPDDLRREIETVTATSNQSISLYRMRRKDYFMGTWLRRSTNYSSVWLGRLLKPDEVWVERSINEEFHTRGAYADLQSALLHYPFNKGLAAWLDKHNRYSDMEAELIVSGGGRDWQWQELTHADPVVRRKALKALVYSLPGRPLIMFLGRYLFSGGILDGRAGLTFTMLKTIYEYMIDAKVKELRRRARGRPV